VRRALTIGIVALALAALAVVVAHPSALAEYQGSSLEENVAPPTTGARHGLADRHPLNRYGLDHHVNAGVTDIDGVPAMVIQWFAATLWEFTRFLVNGVITLFLFAFSLDLVNGDAGAGGRGVLSPIAAATRAIYDTLGQDWLPAAIALAGGLAAWQVFIRREIVRTTSQAAVSVACVLLAILIVTQPQLTIGGIARASHELGLGALALTHDGIEHGDSSRQRAADQLFRTLIYDPWVVLNFGGLEHCVDERDRPVKPDSPACRKRIDHRAKYAERWLRAGPPNSEARTDEYEALRDGKPITLPENEPTRYEVTAADKPAVDIQQQAMAGERLGYVVMILLGELGAVLLLGALAIGVIFGQVLALLLFAFAPLVLIAALFPGAGHAAFRTWLERLLLALARPIIYGLVLGVVLAISSALIAASATLGWLLAFGFQCMFYWAVFLYRRQLHDLVVRTVPGSTRSSGREDLRGRARSAYQSAKPLQPIVGQSATAGSAGAVQAGKLMRDGLTTAGQLAESYAARGHANSVTGHAALMGTAIQQLEAQHVEGRARLGAERVRRKQVAALTARQGDDVLSDDERDRLAELREQSMDQAAFDALRVRVGQVEQRRREGEAPFTDEQIAERVEQIRAQTEPPSETVAASQSAHDPELARRLDETHRLAEQAKTYSRDGYPTIFGPEESPRRSRARWLGPIRRRKDGR
jgi:hypothetical protein